MKKITISLLMLSLVFSATAQMNIISTKSNISTRSSFDSTSVWLNYGTAIDSLTGTGLLYSDYLWPDTEVLLNYDTLGNVSAVPASNHEIGNIFYAYSDNLQEGYSYYFPSPLTAATPYTIDSMALGILYSRANPNAAIVDTLIVYYFQAAKGSQDIPLFFMGIGIQFRC